MTAPDWRQDEAQVAERAERAAQAIVKMKEGLTEYIAAGADDDDLQAIESAFVFFETRGISDKGLFFRSGGVVVEAENASYNSVYGLLQRQPALLLEAMDPLNQCDHDGEH